MTETELLELKEEIDNAKTLAAELKGRNQMLMQQLKENFQLKSLAEAEKKLKSYDKQIEDLQSQIDELLAELEEAYGS